MATVVALIRGINVGAHKRLAMGELRELLGELGYENPRTLLQSGNVVVDTKDKPDKVARDLERAIAKRFGYDVDVIARTAAQISAVVKANPLETVAKDPKKHMVAFLAEKPKASALPKEDFSPEAFALKGTELYVWCPDGLRECKLMKALSEKNLGVRATVRNWSTVTKVDELASG